MMEVWCNGLLMAHVAVKRLPAIGIPGPRF